MVGTSGNTENNTYVSVLSNSKRNQIHCTILYDRNRPKTQVKRTTNYKLWMVTPGVMCLLLRVL